MKSWSAVAALGLAACTAIGPAPVRSPAGGAIVPSAEARVYLPPGYPDAAPYPVLYFLHDYFGDDGILWRQGVTAALDENIRQGGMPPFVLVAPQGDHGYWSDFADGSRRYETWITNGLRSEIEARYAVRRDRAGRAVTGISMGGFGAVKAALRRPEAYAAASSLSGALIALDADSMRSYSRAMRRDLERIFGVPGHGDRLEENDLVRLTAGFANANRARPRLLLRAGAGDKYGLDRAATIYATTARQAGFDVDLVVEPGGHSWSYWRRSFVEVAAWHAARFAEAKP